MKCKTKEYMVNYRVSYKKKKFEALKDKQRELTRLRTIINRHLQFYSLKNA